MGLKRVTLLALLAAMACGAVGALIFAVLTVSLRANQVVTGLTLTIFGTGFAGFMGQSLVGEIAPETIKTFFNPLPFLFWDRYLCLGNFFQQDLFVYFGYLTAVLMGIYLYKTRFGLNLRAIGENPAAADAASVNITLYKYVHILLGGALCRSRRTYLSLVYVPAWSENITAGRGWIAVALVIFAALRILLKLLLGHIFSAG